MIWHKLLQFAGDRRVTEDLAKARISSVDLRVHTNEQLKEAMLDLNNVLRFQRVTAKLLNEWKLNRTRERLERNYGASLDDPELNRKIQDTIDRLKKRRKDARKTRGK